MSDDRTLLEKAARAAELTVQRSRLDDPMHGDFLLNEYGPRNPGQKAQPWNPLTDDGDAFRLAVKLDLNVFQAARSAYALPSDDDGTYEQQVRYSDTGGDPYAATRRAIVRAAASLGSLDEAGKD